MRIYNLENKKIKIYDGVKFLPKIMYITLNSLIREKLRL